MASVRDYRSRLETILRVKEITSAAKKYTSQLFQKYPSLLEKRRVPLVHSSSPTAVFNSPPKKIPEGSIRLNFYTSFDKARFAKQIKPVRPLSTGPACQHVVYSIDIPLDHITPARPEPPLVWRYAAPDATIDLPMTSRGIDIGRARKEFGLKAIAFITDVEPFRMVFNAADENWLSPLAVYNLSKEHTQPIRIFEPQPLATIQSDVTARAQLLLFAFLSLTLDSIKLLLGFPETDGKHITFLYGQRFANIYRFIGEFTGTVNPWILFVGWSLICLMMFLMLWFKLFAAANASISECTSSSTINCRSVLDFLIGP